MGLSGPCRSMTLLLLVMTETSSASMWLTTSRAVELAFTKTASPSSTKPAARRAIALLAMTRREPEGLPSVFTRVAEPYWCETSRLDSR